MKILFIISIIFLSISPIKAKEFLAVQNENETKESIEFKDYKLFMFYVRDSILREQLSTQFMDFSNLAEKDNENFIFKLNWKPKINLKHLEVYDLLINIDTYTNFESFLLHANNNFIIETDRLNYRDSRNNKKIVNVFPNLRKLIQESEAEIELVFGLDNKWNKKNDRINIRPFLTNEQIDSFEKWKSKIGLKKAKKKINRKITF